MRKKARARLGKYVCVAGSFCASSAQRRSSATARVGEGVGPAQCVEVEGAVVEGAVVRGILGYVVRRCWFLGHEGYLLLIGFGR